LASTHGKGKSKIRERFEKQNKMRERNLDFSLSNDVINQTDRDLKRHIIQPPAVIIKPKESLREKEQRQALESRVLFDDRKRKGF